MIDAAQAVLLFVVVLLTILFVVLGIQVFYILREIRFTVQKTNKILDDAEVITGSISGPLSSLSNLTAGFKIGSLITNFFAKKKGIKKIIETTEDVLSE